MASESKPESDWREMIAEFERSGLQHKAIAASKGLNLWTFQGWLYRLRGKQKRRTKPVRMLPVRVRDAAPPSHVELAVAGVLLRVDASVDAAWLARLVCALERRGC